MTKVLTSSARRCCLCFALRGDLSEKKGQIAHLDRDPSNNDLDNLAYLCLEHHDQYDTGPSQARGLHEAEVKEHRERLLERIAAGIDDTSEEVEHARVVSYNQRVGITAGTVNINAAPEPALRARELFVNQSEGEKFHSRIELTVDSPYPPANLYVEIHAPSILEMDLTPQRSGASAFGHCGKRDEWALANLHSPLGKIHLDVYTAIAETLRVEYDFR